MINSENDNEIDFKVHDGYLAFSSEIVRLALFSPVVFTFFITLAGKDAVSQTQTAHSALSPIFVCEFTVYGIGGIFGLFHRYCAIDFMATKVAYFSTALKFFTFLHSLGR